jgi:hypothetical protein
MATTVTKTIGPTGDYSTLQAWEDACPANLVTADEIWRGEVQNTEITGSNGNLLTISGQTTDATRYVELTAVAGASFADHANKTTNPLRYNASVGAGIKNSAAYGDVVVVSTNYTRISRLQFSDAEPGPTRALQVTGTNCVLDQLIIETRSNPSLGGSDSVARNIFLLNRTNSPLAAIATGGSILNCTFVRPSNAGNTTWGLVNNYTSITIRNTAIFGVDNFASVSFTGNNNASNATIGWGTSNQASLTYADQFEEPSAASGTQDFRTKAGAAFIGNGADLSGSGVTTDIVGTARSTPYDISAWQATSSGPLSADIAGTVDITASAAAALILDATIAGTVDITASITAFLEGAGELPGGYARRSRRQRALEAAERRREAERLADARALRLELEAALGMAADVVEEAPDPAVEAVQEAVAVVRALPPVAPAVDFASVRAAVADLLAAIEAARRAKELADDDEDVEMLLRAL